MAKSQEQLDAEKSAAAGDAGTATAATAAKKAVITHPFTDLVVGKKYTYHRKSVHWPKKKDAKGEETADSLLHPCTIVEDTKVDKEKMKPVKFKAVDFDNTGRDVLHDVASIPQDAVFTEA